MMTSLLALKLVPLNFLHLKNIPIYDQLQLEEALLRTDTRNWCLINEGTSPAIVMGISGKADQLINTKKIEDSPVPIIRRFSGGGTVFVDSSTIFITWICNSADSNVSCIPSKLYEWTHSFYNSAFPELNMETRENDYSIGEKKFGGNAQYLAKERWLHHSSLLWDYDPHNMHYLELPQKMPKYRQERSHEDFLCRLKDYFESRTHFNEALIKHLHQTFHIQTIDLHDCQEILMSPHRKATCFHTL